MMFSWKDYREVFVDVYEYGKKYAKPIDTTVSNEMFGDINRCTDECRANPQDAKMLLKREMMKAVVTYLHCCFMQKGDQNSEV